MRAAPSIRDASDQAAALDAPRQTAALKETAVLKEAAAPKRVAAPKYAAYASAPQGGAHSRFLVIGCGHEQQGDEAAGLQVAKAVESWQLASVKTLTVSRLCPDHAAEIAGADYVIFVDACSGQSCSRTVQIEPIVGDFQPLRRLSGKPQGLNPWTLLNLTEQRYGESPQAWLLKVPAECGDAGSSLSATAQLGCDRATTTIARFLQTY